MTRAPMLQKVTTFLSKNTSIKQTVAKNTIWLTVSQIGGRVIRSAIIVYAARVLGTSEYGLFSYAIMLAGLMNTMMDPGVNSVLVREIAKTPQETRRKVFSTALAIKVMLVFFGTGIVVYVGPYFSTLPGAKDLLPITGLILSFDTLREFFLSLVRGMEQMEWDAVIAILTNLAIVTFGFKFMLADPTAKSLVLGYAAGTGIGVIAAIVVLRKYLKPVIKEFAVGLIAPILKSAWPFAVTGALGILLTNIDILIISWMKTASDVGIYSAAIRLIQVIYLLPGIVQLTTLPIFSRLAKPDNQEFRQALEQTISILFLASVPMAVGGVVLGTPIMTLVFGPAFASGGLAFKILIATMVIAFPGSIIVNAIFAYGHQRSLIIASALGGISNVLFDLLFIPRWGIAGSAVATLLAHILSNGYLWYAMREIVYFEVLPHLGKIIAGGGVVAVTTALLALIHVHVLIDIVISAAVYFMVLRILREPILGDIKAIAYGQSAA